MNPGGNLNLICMPPRLCRCSARNTHAALRFPAANGEKGYLSNSPVLTSDGNRPAKEGPAFPESGPRWKFLIWRLILLVGELSFPDGLSWPIRSWRQLTMTLWICQARNTHPPGQRFPRLALSIICTPLHPLMVLLLTSGPPLVSLLPNPPSSTQHLATTPALHLRLGSLDSVEFFTSWWWKASANSSASLSSPCDCLWPGPGPPPNCLPALLTSYPWVKSKKQLLPPRDQNAI